MKNSTSGERLIRIEDKISSIDSTLLLQHESLKEHIRRTDLLEQRVIPVEKTLTMFIGVFKFLTAIAGIVGFVSGIAEILAYFKI